jgi:hypothetical protein
MARRPHPFPGSAKPNAPAGCVCSLVALALGAGTLGVAVMVFALVLPEWRVNHVYVETRCVVLDKRLVENSDEDGTTYRPEVLVRYAVAGQQHQVWAYNAFGGSSGFRSAQQAILDRFTIGREYSLWYDPARPDKAVLIRGYTWGLYLFFIIPVAILVAGLVGGVHALRRHLAPPAPPPVPAPGPSCIPDPAAYAAPATVLAVGLKPGTSPLQSWGGVIVVLVVAGLLIGLGLVPLGVGLFRFIFLVLGALALCGGVTGLLVHLCVGRTAAELSAHPVRPGEPFEVCVRQEGPARLRSLRVSLVCEEQATYQQGTDTRTETKCVYRQNLLHRGEVVAERDAPFEYRTEVTLPGGAMHSFAAAHNRVRWRLVVRGEPAGLPHFERDFPFVVAPAGVAEAATAGPAEEKLP